MNLNAFFQEWLGLETTSDTLPDHYTLFGLPSMEENAEKIRTAIAARFESFLRLDFGAHRAEYVEILQILTEARFTLTNLILKRQYDERFRLMNRTWKKYERPTLRVRMKQFASITTAMVLGVFVVYLMATSVERNPDGSIRYQVETLDAPVAMFTTIPDCVKSRVPRPTSIHAKKRIGASEISVPENVVPDSIDVPDSLVEDTTEATEALEMPEVAEEVAVEALPESTVEVEPEPEFSDESGSSRVGPLYRVQQTQTIAQATSEMKLEVAPEADVSTSSSSDSSVEISVPQQKLPVPEAKAVAEKRAENLRKLLPVLETPDMFDDAVAQLLTEGAKVKEVPITRYTYFLLAIDLSVQKLNVVKTYEILEILESFFELPNNQLRYETTAQLCTRMATQWQTLESSDSILLLLNNMEADMASMLVEGGYEEALAFANQAVELMTRAKVQNSDLLASIQKKQAHANQMIKWKSVAEDCQKKLAANPNDPAANYYFALWLCQKNMRWTDEAIPYFARCKDPRIKAVAQLEQSIRDQGTFEDSRNIFAIAEKWWELTETGKNATENFYFRQHARELDKLIDTAQLGDDEQLRISERMEGQKN